MQNNNVKSWYKLWWVWVIISAFFFLFLICIIGSSASSDTSTDSADTTQVSKDDDSDSDNSKDDDDSDSNDNDTSDYDSNDESTDTNDDSSSTTDDSSSDTNSDDSDSDSDATTDQQSALQQADYYANDANMSKAKIYDQLTSSYGGNFSSSDANYAINHLDDVDWNQNALATAQKYVDDYHMSKSELYDQLTSSYGEQFTASQAQYAINNLD
ncbi:hypothetical protein RZ75_12310 [Apilactobacillus kunkeei]|uniref:Ltp family lipoprotein n=1 Tax=Apilactobacillus kunkeei TaxID=148814 RepID=UPI0006B24CEE|nr:Ltp family lipoprotein [Apilactobacillus kunkeei]KOY78262.1 hypothetical protein RZ75_12310 [Apilactobacillus kunkeei]